MAYYQPDEKILKLKDANEKKTRNITVSHFMQF